MIQQSKLSRINSRSECDIYENGFLPLITAPMYSVVNPSNYKFYLENNIRVCMPRNVYDGYANTVDYIQKEAYFDSMNLKDFEALYLKYDTMLVDSEDNHIKTTVCIDTANGNMKQLHDAIIAAKKKYGDKIVIMAGNVSNVLAFIELAYAGCDYIRVGIGGGLGCTTTSNVGVGQENLEDVIKDCKDFIISQKSKYTPVNTKIVADGISSYIKLCETKYGFNSNGYAAINKLLYSGADLVMVGSLFAKSEEIAGDEYIDYAGMSTLHEQSKYRQDNMRNSEGKVETLKVEWKLKDWLKGSPNQDSYPYLSGFENNLKSAMSYTNSKTLHEFCN